MGCGGSGHDFHQTHTAVNLTHLAYRHPQELSKQASNEPSYMRRTSAAQVRVLETQTKREKHKQFLADVAGDEARREKDIHNFRKSLDDDWFDMVSQSSVRQSVRPSVRQLVSQSVSWHES